MFDSNQGDGVSIDSATVDYAAHRMTIPTGMVQSEFRRGLRMPCLPFHSTKSANW